MTKTVTLRMVRATNAGWKRRPELDSDLTDAWEMADGKICRVTRGREPEVQKMVTVEEVGP